MPITPDIPAAQTAIVELSNDFRRANALGEVRRNEKLAKAAREYARFLAATPIFSHEADGRRPSDRIKAAGYQPCRTAENLAWLLDSRGFETKDLARQMVEGWKASPPHRKNLMLTHVTETGVAIAKVRGAEKYIGVQLFARPLSMQYSFQIENRAARAVAYSVGGERMELQPRTLVRHTVCEPAAVEFQIASGGLLSKADSTRFQARHGQLFRLIRSPSGTVRVELAKH